MLEIRIIAHGSREYDEAIGLRRAVLRTPLGLDFAPEDLAREAGDTHLAAYVQNRLAGIVVMTPQEADKAKLRQMAVAQDMRGQAVGRQLLAAFEDHARATGVKNVILSARTTARGFYTRHGYETDDVVITEVTIPHIRMWKAL